MNNTLDETSVYDKYWAGVFSMDRENILKTLILDDLKHANNKELCKLFKFLSCFFCCLDQCEPCPEPKPEPKPCPCPCPYHCTCIPCEPDKDKQLYKVSLRHLLYANVAPFLEGRRKSSAAFCFRESSTNISPYFLTLSCNSFCILKLAHFHRWELAYSGMAHGLARPIRCPGQSASAFLSAGQYRA